MKTYVLAVLIGTTALGSLAAGPVVSISPAQAMPVFDASNYAQNMLTAARTLQQINQQIQSLQNEAAMLSSMAKNLSRTDFPQLDQLRQRLRQIDDLMGQAQGIDFRVDQLDAKFRSLFPDSFDQALRLDRRLADAKARLDAAIAGFQKTMTVQSQVVENVRDDAQALSEIVAKSQDAEGGLQAAQATNQLLALATKQQFQLQQMMAAQYRSETIEQARRVQEGQEARAATRKFLGNGKAYASE